MLKNWLRILIIILLVLGIFFRFANLEQKPYWGDESLTSHRIAGYTSQEVQTALTQNKVFTIEEIQKYQQPDPTKDLMNLIKKGLRSPLYHLMGRSWMEALGDRVSTPRGVSAILSLLVFPCIYLLCRELFESPNVGWMAIALTAVSPLHVIYAQEAREYSMWTVTVLLSCWALLRAMRFNTTVNWLVYGATLMLTLYTHLFSVIVFLGQSIYFLLEKLNEQKSLLNKKNFPYLLVCVAGFGFFVLKRIVTKGLPQPPCWTGWNRSVCGISSPTPFPSLAQTWILNLSRVFVDFNESFSYKNFWFYLPIILLSIYSLYFLYRHTTKPWLFVYILTGSLSLFLAIPDVFFQGQGSTPIRYLIPSYLGLQIAVAFLFVTKITSKDQKNWQQKLWKIITLIVISSGVASCAVYTQTNTWWNKYAEYYHSEVAKIVNQSDRALVIAPWFNMLTLSHVLNPDIMMYERNSNPEINLSNQDFTNIFIYKSKESLKYFSDNNPDYKLQDSYIWKRQTTPVNTTQTQLWHLIKK